MFVLWTLALLAALFVVQWLKWKHESITRTPNFYRLKKTLGGLNESCLLVHYLSLFSKVLLNAVRQVPGPWSTRSGQCILCVSGLHVIVNQYLEPWNFMTFHSVGNVMSSQLTKSIILYLPWFPAGFQDGQYPLVNIQKTIENSWFTMIYPLKMVIVPSVFGMFTRPGKCSVAGWIPWIPASWTKTSRCKP